MKYEDCDSFILGLPERVRKCLINAGISSREQVERMSEKELLSLRNFGQRCLYVVQEALEGRQETMDIRCAPTAERNICIRELRRKGVSYTELSKTFGVTKDRLRQICSKADRKEMMSLLLSQKRREEGLG